ncbi:hypothetical protein KJ865_12375, partial [Myxococcota bacterium]|nr:hypothetical protein [Myxococcota bacterium]
IIAISIAFVIFSASGNKAHADDPSIHWKKLTTKNFTITFPSEYRNTAQRVASMAEEAHRLLVPLMGHKTASPTHIVISSYTDQANGSATVYFRKTIRLFLTFPSDISELSDFDDWLWILIVHEYTHILHMDTMGQLPRLINKIFGQLWVPNSLLPTWVVESMAVYSETKFSSVGRNRSSIYSMYLRASVLDNQLLSLAQITSAPIPYPHGTIPYLYGSRFLWYLARKYSDSTLKHFSASYGSTLIPFGVNKSARKAFGRTFVELYKEFSAFLHKQVATFVAPVRDRGIRRGQAITRGGEFKFYPVFHPTDPTTLVYIGHDGHSPNALHLVKITGAGQVIHHERLHGRMIGPGRPSWGNNSLWFHNLEMHKATYSFNDVYQLRLGTKSFRRVTRGGRISSPDFSFRKKVLVAVKSSATSSDLVQLNTRGKVDKVILRGAQYEQFYTPSLSPGGDEVVFSRYKSGKRDICLYNLKTNTLTSITNDRAMDTGPVFSPDGAYILFSSDRTEIFNIYAYHLKTGALFQVTNVLNGAFAPSLSADGRLLAYAGYTSKGYEIFILPFSPRAFLNPLEPLPVREAAHFMPRGPTYKISDYSPLPYLSPVAWFADWGYTVSNAASLTMMGFDPLNHHSWYMTANYSPQEELGELYLSYGNNQTPIPVEVSLTTGQYNKNNMNVNEAWHQYPWNYFKGEVAATFPFVSQMRQTLAGYLYGSAYRGIPREERPVPRPDSPLPVWPEGSWRASVKAG